MSASTRLVLASVLYPSSYSRVLPLARTGFRREAQRLTQAIALAMASASSSHMEGTDSGANIPPAEGEKFLSKAALKKLAKQQRAVEVKAQKKISKKESRKAEQAKKREETQRYMEQLTQQEKAELQQQAQIRREERKQEAAKRKQQIADAMITGQRLVVDLAFDDKMSNSEVKSLCQQLAFCYAQNIKAQCPACLQFTSLTGRIVSTLEYQASGLSSWKVLRHEEPYEELFKERKDDLVYLSADAPQILESINPNKVYIIGGIVDHNRYKRLCQDKAEKQGIATAKLPIEEHIELTGSKVLTVNQVVAILLNWLDCKDWAIALNTAIPERKRKPKGTGGAGKASTIVDTDSLAGEKAASEV